MNERSLRGLLCENIAQTDTADRNQGAAAMNWAYRWECESCRWPYVKSGSCTTVASVNT